MRNTDRAFEVLELFEAQQKPLTLSEVVAHLKYPFSSCSILLRRMADLGYLKYEPNNRTYMPSSRTALLGNWVFQHLFVEAHLLSLIQRVHELTGETVMTGMRRENYCQYIHVIQSRFAVDYHLRPGTLRPIHASGLGLALLTTYSDTEITKLVRWHNAQRANANHQIDQRDLLDVVGKGRKRGYIYSRNIVAQGSGAIAMALPKRKDSVEQFGIAVGGMVSRLDGKEDKIVAILRECIQDYAVKSGYGISTLTGSAKAKAAGDDAPQNLSGAAPNRINRRVQNGIGKNGRKRV